MINVTTRKNSYKGFALIEVLIALFVFAIGILTVAGLQVISKKTNFDAVQRTTATLLAHDITARMRANDPDRWGSYLVENLSGTGMTAPAADCGAAGAGCNADQLATYDLYEWGQALAGASEGGTGGLVDARACIRGPAAGGDGSYYIIIAWRGVTELSNPTIDSDVPPGSGNTGCGVGLDLYGEDDAGRRVLLVPTYMAY